MVKFGNVASEHVKSAITVVQPQLCAAQQNPSAKQQNRIGALVTHHPALMSHHTGGSRKGHPRYTGAQQWEGRGWPDQEIGQSAADRHEMQKLFNSTQIYSKDHLLVSRIRSLHLLLEVILRAEEECSVFLPLGTLEYESSLKVSKHLKVFLVLH